MIELSYKNIKKGVDIVTDNELVLAISNVIDKKLAETVQPIQDNITSIKLHLENMTDKHIQLLAENFIELTDKLNQAIPATNKNLAYEIKVNYLIEKLSILKRK